MLKQFGRFYILWEHVPFRQCIVRTYCSWLSIPSLIDPYSAVVSDTWKNNEETHTTKQKEVQLQPSNAVSDNSRYYPVADVQHDEWYHPSILVFRHRDCSTSSFNQNTTSRRQKSYFCDEFNHLHGQMSCQKSVGIIIACNRNNEFISR